MRLDLLRRRLVAQLLTTACGLVLMASACSSGSGVQEGSADADSGTGEAPTSFESIDSVAELLAETIGCDDVASDGPTPAGDFERGGCTSSSGDVVLIELYGSDSRFEEMNEQLGFDCRSSSSPEESDDATVSIGNVVLYLPTDLAESLGSQTDGLVSWTCSS